MDGATTRQAGEATSQAHEHAFPDAMLWRRLLHRWLVEYNPLYLLSAMLVLAGVILISRGLAREETIDGQVGVAAIAEVYAWALIGGAALLTRIDLRRPAAMLALLTALYQGDLTLHTETCAWLGSVGVVAAIAWLAMFVAKLHALAWAVRVRLPPSAFAVPTFGAVGLVVLPRLLHDLAPHTLTTLVAGWVFALFALGLWTSRDVTSTAHLDSWGQTVLHRALRATWVMWGLLALCHVAFWASESRLRLVALVPVALLLSTRWIRHEAAVGAAVAATLVFAGATMPEFFSLVALLSAVVLALHALRAPAFAQTAVHEAVSTGPYRTPAAEPPPPPRPLRPTIFARASRPAMWRLLAGAMFGLYLSCWTFGWSGGPWPAHVLPFDLALSGAVLVFVWRVGARAVIAPLVLTWLHLCVQRGLISPPESTLQWGAAAVGLGFTLLVGSLATSWRLRRFRVDADVATASAERRPCRTV